MKFQVVHKGFYFSLQLRICLDKESLSHQFGECLLEMDCMAFWRPVELVEMLEVNIVEGF